MFFTRNWNKNSNAKQSALLRASFALWNLCLSIFSVWGFINTVEHFPENWYKDGYLCADPFTRNRLRENFTPGTALIIFIFSKIPELLDTLFLILKGKKIRVLQWYHHCTVMLFVWFALATEYAPGMWFAIMNYLVHSVMYMYFALAETFPSKRKTLRKIGPFVTLMQTSQMVIGLAVNASAAYVYFEGTRDCHITKEAIYAAIVMYFSYFVLFAKLFYDSVIRTREVVAENCCGGEFDLDAKNGDRKKNK
ncbi:elongation of very long chain fatty acids protein [bacterium]|nr:elongation of very long chain fatty acids protein [bacterium]